MKVYDSVIKKNEEAGTSLVKGAFNHRFGKDIELTAQRCVQVIKNGCHTSEKQVKLF